MRNCSRDSTIVSPDLKLRVGQVAEITKIPRDRVNKWAQVGLLGEERDGERGGEHRFSLADVKKAMYLDSLSSVGKYSDDDFLRFMEDEKFGKSFEDIIALSGASLPVLPQLKDEGSFLDFYNYIMPRLIEACYVLVFGYVKPHVSVAIDIPASNPASASRAVIATVDERRIVTTYHAAKPFFDEQQTLKSRLPRAARFGLAIRRMVLTVR